MGINTCYQLFMENPQAIALLSLPENYQKEDFAEYLEERVLYADCRQTNQPETLQSLIYEAMNQKKILCLDHINFLQSKPFWESISPMILCLLKQEDYHTAQGILPVSQMRLLLPHSESEINDTSLKINLLERACRNALMIEK